MKGSLISLKGEGSTWVGVSDETNMFPGASTFAELENFYITKDGTELRRIPGSRLVAKAVGAEPWTITGGAAVSGNRIRLTLDVSGRGNGDHFLGNGDKVYVPDGVTGVPEGIYEGIRWTATEIDLDDARITGAPTSGTVFLRRGMFLHTMASVDDRLVSVFETRVLDSADASTTKNNIGSAVSLHTLDYETVQKPVDPRTTQPTSGIEFFPCPTMLPINEGADHEPASWHMDILGRMSGDVINRKLCIAVPGHGCLFEVDLAYAWPNYADVPPAFNERPDYRWTRALGIPSGVVAQDAVGLHPTGIDYPATGSGVIPDGEYYYAAGFIDIRTGAAGIVSESRSFTVANPNSGADGADQVFFMLLPPRAILPETVGLATVLYIGTSATALWPQAIAGPWPTRAEPMTINTGGALVGGAARSGDCDYVALRVFAEITSETKVEPNRVPVLEQMMQGSAWCRVVHGRLISSGDPRPYYSFNARRWSQNTIVVLDEISGLQSGRSPCAWGRVPDAYAGNRLNIPFNTSSPTTFFPESVFVERTGNAQVDSTLGGPRDARNISLKIATTVPTSGTPETVQLETAPQRIQVSEEGAPGVSPATGRLENDTILGGRTTACARLGNEALVFTSRSTRHFVWAAVPSGQSSAYLSETHGCIAPNSVVEGPGFAAWLSHDGPCVFRGGGVEWIGERIRNFWGTLRRESDGMMNSAHRVVDLERGLVIWNVVDDTNADPGNDRDRVREGSNAQIIWSYRNDSFTTARRPGGLASQAAASLPVRQGGGKHAWEPCFQSDETSLLNSAMWPVFAADETALDCAWDDLSDVTKQTATVVTGYADGATNIQFTIDDGWAVENVDAGVKVMVVDRRGRLRSVLEVTGPGDPVALTVPVKPYRGGGLAWEVGDKLWFRVIPCHMRTHRIALSLPGFKGKAIEGVVRLELTTDYPAFGQMRAVNDQDGTVSLGRGFTSLASGTNRFRRAQLRASEASFELDVISAGPVSIQDIHIVAEP